jgi:hypothetical protein
MTMRKSHPRYEVIVRWGKSELNIVGRGAILGWAATALFVIGIKTYNAQLLALLHAVG